VAINHALLHVELYPPSWWQNSIHILNSRRLATSFVPGDQPWLCLATPAADASVLEPPPARDQLSANKVVRAWQARTILNPPFSMTSSQGGVLGPGVTQYGFAKGRGWTRKLSGVRYCRGLETGGAMTDDAPVHNRQAGSNPPSRLRTKLRRLRRLKHIVPLSRDQQLALIEEARAARTASAREDTDNAQRR